MFNKVDQNRIIATFSHLVSIPSESGHEQLTLEFLQDFFEQKNYRAEIGRASCRERV